MAISALQAEGSPQAPRALKHIKQRKPKSPLEFSLSVLLLNQRWEIFPVEAGQKTAVLIKRGGTAKQLYNQQYVINREL